VSYEILPEFPQDSPEWHEARRASLGASEVAAVLGLSPWQTPLSVYRSKMGVPNEIPEDLAFFGHELEAPIAKWISKKHPEVGLVSGARSVRSVEFSWLSATPDRMTYGPDGLAPQPIPIELKTSSAYSKDAWRDGVPDYYRIQSIVQQGVIGAPYGWLAVLHGGNSPELHRIPFDPEVWEQIVRITGKWWEAHVVAKVPPEPVTLAEQAELWPTTAGKTIDLSETAFEAVERRTVLLADIQAQKAEADALQLAIGEFVQNAETLLYQGRPVATYKTHAGRRTVSVADAERDAPHLIQQGAPFKVLRIVKQKEQK